MKGTRESKREQERARERERERGKKKKKKHTGCVASLQDVQRPTHVSPTKPDKRLGRLGHNLDILLLNHLIHQHPDIRLLERTKPEPRAPRQQRGRELVRVIGNDAESRVDRVLFHDAPQRHLRRVGHGICLVQDNQLVARDPALCRCRGEYLLGGGERLDLLAHYVDAAVVRRVELQHHLPHVFGPVYSPGEGEDRGCLARAGGAVEQKVGEPVGVDEFYDCGEDVLVAGDVGKRSGAVLFDPMRSC